MEIFYMFCASFLQIPQNIQPDIFGIFVRFGISARFCNKVMED